MCFALFHLAPTAALPDLANRGATGPGAGHDMYGMTQAGGNITAIPQEQRGNSSSALDMSYLRVLSPRDYPLR